ncbi:hypothetical protein GXW78_12195 [Roseomonas terrae]|uniref:Antifreeze protein n=1 Tax=Neoroseomonas terrae TaxID=424799 RepID=A0ABS5EIF5_9PROT|nr:hypothetical protein [Neoroseomonas terrae]MBR0650427.1 hypothetical protein [Neoroseomonas terrae]
MMFRRSLALLSAEPAMAGTALMQMAVEKQLAFSQGAAAAGLALARGASPDAVMSAALRPARQRVRRNVRGKGLA